ncbi:unnamed protein product [Sphagnum troendelagicum]|uniref:Uncharacterized protein n=1 Tax=Sphagnum troendelagicum TaxID=128251 RepID=A0ABP0UMZ8_9BRYO
MASVHVGNPRAHILITANGRNAVVFETKSGGLGPLQGDPWPLHKVWVPFSCSTGTIWPSLLQSNNCHHFARMQSCAAGVMEVLIIGAAGNLNCWCKCDITEGGAEWLIGCIFQLYEYMVLAHVGYGVLTDVRNWYLMRRDNAGCLLISAGFKASDKQPPLLAALAWLVASALDSTVWWNSDSGGGDCSTSST